jgi:Mrp family chromosome partitioning ATPase
MVSAPLSPFPEAIRRLKVAVDQLSGRLSASARGTRDRQGLIVVVASSTASEGKSSVALALARAFSIAHGHVAIIDADFRRPSIREMAGLPKDDSFHQLLLATGPDDERLKSLEVDADRSSSVTIVAGSTPSTGPTDHLINGGAFSRLIERMRTLYDVVVIDTPPVGPVSDTLYLAALADVVVFVVRSGTTSQTEARLAVASIKDVLSPDSNIIAFLNQQDHTSARYRQRYGGYYVTGS